jgi:hypothetical protein
MSNWTLLKQMKIENVIEEVQITKQNQLEAENWETYWQE